MTFAFIWHGKWDLLWQNQFSFQTLKETFSILCCAYIVAIHEHQVVPLFSQETSPGALLIFDKTKRRSKTTDG